MQVLLRKLSIWFAEQRRLSERGILERQGTWGDTVETLEWLLREIEVVTFTRYSATIGQLATFEVSVDNVETLLLRLDRAIEVLRTENTVERYPPGLLRNTNLDSFLVTLRQMSVHPTDATQALTSRLREFIQTFQTLVSIDHESLSYYRRRYERLMRDLRLFTEALIAASDQSHPQ